MKNRALLRRLRRLTHLQCAVDGCWEQALRLCLEEPCLSPTSIQSWVGQSVDFAIEMFFSDIEGNPHFVGVRWNGKNASQVADLVLKAHDTLERFRSHHVDEVLAAFDIALDTKLLNAAPTFFEIGVNNLWKSVGSLVIWRRREGIPNRDELDANLRRHAPQLLLEQPNEIMLEIGYVDPQPHWLGLCTSRRQGNKYRLDLDEALKIALEFGEQGSLDP